MSEKLLQLASFGIRRTGSAGEERTRDWISAALESAGYRIRSTAFSANTLVYPEVKIGLGSETCEGFLQWMPPVALPAPLEGGVHLSLPGDARPGDCVVRAMPGPFSAYWTDALEAEVKAAAHRGAAAYLMCTETPSGSIFAYNRSIRLPDLPIPVVLYARRDHDLILAAAVQKHETRLSLSATRTAVSGVSLIGARPGKGAGLVISTPMTGWFGSVAERAPGIILARQLAEAYAEASFPVWIVASSGHEIGHLGMQQILGELAPLPEEVGLWIHLGASLGATAQDEDYLLKSLHFRMATPGIAALVDEAFGPMGLSPLDPSQMRNGETGDVLSAGYKDVLGLTGVAATFHTPVDDGAAVNTGRLEQYERALRGVIDHRFGQA
ncbi:hypothetical protein [Hyphomonas sp.]|uniref:hypothetical protein n=1 Tax=Hyphomonas sp. TaxID=87 RepID=UPI0025BFBFD3|nr:hypothetical protein [Hyphomonas sp.]MBI1401024.1 hypothetical protein [Hyphomonas sp.]